MPYRIDEGMQQILVQSIPDFSTEYHTEDQIPNGSFCMQKEQLIDLLMKIHFVSVIGEGIFIRPNVGNEFRALYLTKKI